MPRTNATDVKAILVGNMENVNDSVDAFITAANLLVTQKCASKTNADGSAYYTDAHLTAIEQWLAAHFYKIPNPADLIRKVSADAENRIESKVDLGLNVTRWGQQALALDTAGGLAEVQSNIINPRRRWGVLWLGRKPEDQTPRASS